jgi:hypothetical protein
MHKVLDGITTIQQIFKRASAMTTRGPEPESWDFRPSAVAYYGVPQEVQVNIPISVAGKGTQRRTSRMTIATTGKTRKIPSSNATKPQLSGGAAKTREEKYKTIKIMSGFKFSYLQYEAYTLINGAEYKCLDRVVRISQNTYGDRTAELVLVTDDDAPCLESMKMTEAEIYAKVIDESATQLNNYRAILNNPLFQKIYGMKKRELLYLNKDGNEFKKQVDSGACMNCGLFLPWDRLSIDHQRPKGHSGPKELIPAILKTLRAIELTVEGPKGPKAELWKFTNAELWEKLNRLPHLPQPVRDTVIPRHKIARPEPAGGSRENRYTLNHKGTIFYTLIRGSSYFNILGNACMHGLLNLRPYCSTCNSARQQGEPKFPVQDE